MVAYKSLLAGIAILAMAESRALAANDEESIKARPVTVLRLEAQEFAREARFTGSVGLYRQEKVGFEVAARLLSVLDLGKEVNGPAYDEQGALVRQGDIIARLDDTRHRLMVQALEARLGSLRNELAAQRIDVDQVAIANLDAERARLRIANSDITVAEKQIVEAVAEVTRTRKDLNRQKKLRSGPAGRQKAVDDAQAAHDTALARKQQREALLDSRRRALDAQRAIVAVAEATILLKQAQVEATAGRIAELEAELKRAREDLADTVLYAPFSGRVTEIHSSQGAVITAGQPVVTLTLMDPIQVRFEVSADTERRIRTGDRAWVYPKDPTDPDRSEVEVNAIVFEKGAVADPNTRTFRIDLMARNRRRMVHDVDPATKGLPVVTDFLPVARRFEGEGGPLFVPTLSIYREGKRTFVLRLPGIAFHEGAQRNAVGKHTPDKVEITLGDDYFTVIKWNFRSLKGSGVLREGDFLVIGPTEQHLDGLVIDRPQWLLRPGDILPVRLFLNMTPRGFYVPVDAITVIDGNHVVFEAGDGKARIIPVTVHDTYQELRRIESNQLRPGIPIIVGGVRFVSDGQPVSIVGEESLSE